MRYLYGIVNPPSTEMDCPVIESLQGDTNIKTDFAKSSTVVTFLRGVTFAI